MMKEEKIVRKLASVQAVAGVRPIDGADAIEVVEILGWNVVSKKGGILPWRFGGLL
jgi:hypothetical protein